MNLGLLILFVFYTHLLFQIRHSPVLPRNLYFPQLAYFSLMRRKCMQIVCKFKRVYNLIRSYEIDLFFGNYDFTYESITVA